MKAVLRISRSRFYCIVIIIIVIIIIIILQYELTTTAPCLLWIMSQVCNLLYFCVPEYRVALMQGWWKCSRTCGDYTVDQTCCNDHETRINCVIGSECKKQFSNVCKRLFFFEVGHTVDLSYNYYVKEQSTQLSIYHLMLHVSTLKSHHETKILVMKRKSDIYVYIYIYIYIYNRFCTELRFRFYKFVILRLQMIYT